MWAKKRIKKTVGWQLLHRLLNVTSSTNKQSLPIEINEEPVGCNATLPSAFHANQNVTYYIQRA
jgi:hypothetical protein